MADALYNLSNNFYIGNYQAAINEADSIPESEEKTVFVYRCYIGLGNYQLVQEEISDDETSASLVALKYFAKYLADRSSVVEVQEKFASLSQTETTAICSALVCFYENQVDEGLRIVAPVKTIECLSIMVHGLLMLNRTDKAEEILRRMQQQDEDHTITALTGTWVTISKGDQEIKDAFYQFQELMDKFAPTPLLLNGLASYNLKTDKFEEAQSALQESLEKNPTHPDTISNLISCAAFSSKSPSLVEQGTSRQVRQLKANDPDHVWLSKYEAFGNSFDKFAAQFSPSK